MYFFLKHFHFYENTHWCHHLLHWFISVTFMIITLLCYKNSDHSGSFAKVSHWLKLEKQQDCFNIKIPSDQYWNSHHKFLYNVNPLPGKWVYNEKGMRMLEITYCKTSSISRTKSQSLKRSFLCSIHWSQVLSWEWRCSWSSADRRCSNYNSLKWCHYECYGISNHGHLDALFNRLFRQRSKKTSKICVIGLCDGKPPVTGGTP